jgi:hypothetical protein
MTTNGENIETRILLKPDLGAITDLLYRSPLLTDGDLMTTNGDDIETRTLVKADLSDIPDLLYKTNIGPDIDGDLLTTDGQNLIKKEISTSDLTGSVDIFKPVKDENNEVSLTSGKIVKSKITRDENNEITKLELEDKNLEKSDLVDISDLVYKSDIFENNKLVKTGTLGELTTTTISTSDLTDNSSIVKTDDNRLIDLTASNNDKIVTVDNGQIVYKTLSFVSDNQTFDFPEDEEGNRVLPEGGITITGQHAQITASPAALCLFNSQGEIDAFTMTNDKFLESIMGYSSVDKTDTFGQGLVPRGNSTHESQFLRKDGSWAMPSVYTGSVADNLRSMNDFPSNYTGHQGKYLKIENDPSYPSGSGVVFTSISDDIQNYINSGDLAGLSVNGVIQAESFLSVSDKRLKKDINPAIDLVSIVN